MTADPLSFLDDSIDESTNDEIIPKTKKKPSDSLDFLGESEEPEQSLIMDRNMDRSTEGKSTDPLAFLDQEQEQQEEGGFLSLFKPKPYGEEPVYAEDKTPEEIENMSLPERQQYVQDLLQEREYRQSKGFTKGALSGATIGFSEKIPGLKPEEEDLLVGLGETVGSYLPITKLYNWIGKPLVTLASKSNVARQGLMALAEMTGFGITGVTYKAGKGIVKGEIPTAEELAKEGATWAAINGVMQGLGLGVTFTQSVQRIAEAEGVTAKEVLGKLWDSTKNYMKFKLGKPVKGEIIPEDIQALIERAKLAEKEGLSIIEAEFEVVPEVKSEPIKSTEAAEVKPEIIPEVEPQTFTTLQGSTYTVNPDGTTTRTKAARAEHPGEEGPQPKSEKTWFVTQDDANKLSEFQAMGGADKRIVELPDGRIGIMYESGKNAGKIEQRTIVQPQMSPANDLLPIESWNGGKNIHFGNQIVQVGKEAPHEGISANTEEKPSKLEPEKTHKAKEEVSELPKKPTKVPPLRTRPLKPSLMGKKQAIARSKILDVFRTAFTDPIRLGKISQRNATGIHKLWPKVTRLLKDNDIETAAHEIGHNLHTTLYGGDAKTSQEQIKNIEVALRPYLDELKPLAHYEPWGMEGFAEFTRLYVTNPDIALELAPKFYNKFETDLEAQYPELKNALIEARDYYDTYLQGTPQSRIRAQTSYSSDRGKLANIIDSVKKNLNLDFLKTQFLDDVFPAKRLVAEAFGIPLTEVENLKDERNLYRALRVLKGAVGKGDVFVLHETFNTNLEKVNGSLKDILKQLPDEESYREFNDYLIARRAIEKHGQEIDTGIEFGDAVAVEIEMRPKYGELAKELDKYNDTLLKYARDAGLLSPQQYIDIKKNNLMYVPFQRVMETEKGGMASGSGNLQAGKIIKRMKGSTRDIIAPVESILKNTYAILINSEKNLAGQVLAKIAKMKDVGGYVEAVPTPIGLKAKVQRDEIERSVIKHLKDNGQADLLVMSDGKLALRSDLEDLIPDVILKFGATSYPAGENIVTVYFEGKPKYYEVSPELFQMWQNGTSPYVAGLLTKILRIPAKTLRAGAILNPKFMMKNVVRDTWGSWLFTKYGKSAKDPVGIFIDTIYSPLAMLATSAAKGKLYVEWMKSGGAMGTMQTIDRNNVVKKLDEVRHGLRPHQVMKWLRLVAEISEEANRLSEFDRAIKVEGNTRLGKEIAAFAARDLSIDFAKMGLQTKALNQIIPFWNATVQGGDKLIRAMVNPKDRKEFLPRILGFIVIPSLILAWLNQDDENVKEFYEEEKDFNFITRVGDQYIKIPVPFETGVIAHGLTQRMYSYFIKKDPEAFEKFMGSVLDAMIPNITPSFANPFLETWANKSFFTGARIIPQGKEGLVAKYQYKNGTSSTSRLLGRAMTYMLGQETRSRAASPAIIDHFITSWTGGLGRLMINISDASLEAGGISDKIPGPQQAITEKLGLDAFIAKYPRASTRSIEKFYDNYADATAQRKSFKYAEKMELEPGEDIEVSQERFERIYDYKSLQKGYKAIQACQKEINNIWNDPSIEPDMKKQMIDDLYLQMIEFARAANEDIRQYRLAQEA
jgi:hypothetical protein